jgi:hypothetical protein
MTAYRVRVLFEDYFPDQLEVFVEQYAEDVKKLLTDHLPWAKVIVYVEANPPEDEVEEWLSS